MKITHPIYGHFNITEPVLMALLKSPAIQRLKKIDNLGAYHLHEDCAGNLSRYRHSLGVMLLLRKFGASLNEQIAGLLHDVSHTAFSHLADRVFGRHLTQDYQDQRLSQAFKINGINKILRGHQIAPEKILDFSRYPLLERELPDLCADRIDYTLNDSHLPYLTKNRPKNFLAHLIVSQNQFVFSDKNWAKKFGLLSLRLNQKVWANPLNIALSSTLAGLVKAALARKHISKQDFYLTDKIFLAKLKKIKDSDIAEPLKRLKMMRVKVIGQASGQLYCRTKSRVVNPSFLQGSRLVKLSVVDQSYHKKISAYNKILKKGFNVRILKAD